MPIHGEAEYDMVGEQDGQLYSLYVLFIKDNECISDEDGYFRIIKYPLKSFYMGVYKQGYVCWDESHAFWQEAPINEKNQYGVKIYNVKDKPGFHVKNGMVIALEPFTATDSQIILRHAQFTDSVSLSAGGLSGIGKEVGIVMEDIRMQKEEHDNKMKERKKERETGATK